MTFPTVSRRNVRACALGIIAAASVAAGSVQAQLTQQNANPFAAAAAASTTTQPTTDPQQQQQQSASPFTPSASAAQNFQPTTVQDSATATPYSTQDLMKARQGSLDLGNRAMKPAKPGEFEDYVANLIGRRLPRYGEDLLLPSQRDFAAPATASVPADYPLNVGDAVSLSFTGSISGSLDREIDTTGKIFLPDVGPVQLAGVRFGDLKDRISHAVAGKYRDFTVSVSVKQLRGIRVYVTGFANNPGAFTVGSLSTLANAIFQAGGPSSGGSFRSVKLYRNGRQVTDFDLYQLLRDGNRIGDAVLQNEDVLFVPPAGEQVAVIGSVHQEAIYETLPGETLETMLRIAGGANVLGDPDRLILYNMRGPQNAGPRVVARLDAARLPIEGGDILQVLSKGSLLQPMARQSAVVRIEGEVNHPGNYFLPPGTPISAVVEAAGGLTDRAYPFGAKLARQSVREQQKESYKEAIRQVEFMLASAPLTTDTANVSGDQRAAQAGGARALLDQLKALEPDGRVVMLVSPSARELPSSVLLENNDQILVPPRPTTVGVFGAVYRQGSFLLEGPPLKVRDYIERAGGTQRAADRRNIFVVRANGEVLTSKKGGMKAAALPGDVIFVPVTTMNSNFWTRLRGISDAIFAMALTAAVIHSL